MQLALPRAAASGGQFPLSCRRLRAAPLQPSRAAPRARAAPGGSGSPAEGPSAGSAQPGHLEPPPADGEGPEYSMKQVDERTWPGYAAPAAAPSSAAAGAGAQQDGRYHFTHQGPEEVGELTDESWECLGEPEALERAHGGSGSAQEARPPQAPPMPHIWMFRGEVEEGGYREPGQDIASALPGRWGENEDFEADMTAEAAEAAQQGEAGERP